MACFEVKMAYKSGYDVPDTLPCGEISQFKVTLSCKQSHHAAQ